MKHLADPFHCCYYDTKKLNELLNYQHHTFNDLLEEMVTNAKPQRILAKIFKPLVKPSLLLLSPYYKEFRKEQAKTKKTKTITNS